MLSSRLPLARRAPALSAAASPRAACCNASGGELRRWRERRRGCYSLRNAIAAATRPAPPPSSVAVDAAASSSSSSSSSSAAARGRRKQSNSRRYQHSPESVLAQCESLWPAWAAAGCRLEAPNAPKNATGAPTPDQAAAGLRAAADAAARLPPAERELLATDRRVRGLVECLRVTATRSGGGGGGEGGGGAASFSSAASSSSSPSSSSLSAEAAPDAAVGLALLGGREGCHDEALAAVLRLAISDGEGGGVGREGGGGAAAASSLPSPSPSPPPLDLHPAAAADLLRAMAIARYADKRVLCSLDAVLGAATREKMSSNGSKSRGSGSSGSGSGSGGKANEQSPSPSDISAALWAFAVLQHQPEALLAGDEGGGEGRGESPVASLLASAASAAAGGSGASSSSPSPSGFRSRRAPPVSPSTAATAVIRPRDLASSLWALAALGRVSGGAFAAGWAAALALGRGGMAPAGDAGLSQLHLAGAAANLLPPATPTGDGGAAAAAAAAAPPLLRGGWVARLGTLPRVGEGTEGNGDSEELLALLEAAAEHAWLRASALRAGAAASRASPQRRAPSSPSTLQRQVVSSLASILGRGVGEEGVCPVTWLPVDALVPARRLARAQRASLSFDALGSSSSSTPRSGATATAAEAAGEAKQLDSPSSSSDPAVFPFLGLALEVDGPLHDLRGPDGGPGVPTGGTALKRRLLAAAGWSVVVVGHREWSEAGSGVAAREMLLRKLEEAGVV